ncbi:50S ribosomal protein L6 [Mycoplasmopsis equigenitalium]|uniref:Large ribosomal subunit protein uL6 n=1 Tax=Mycoplasmopsis equigenitalium TaxID=114883 RepID=A0ABY5J2S9_9BACT|nr:50S ribosomal protein L6 [Mycoplasmopsis equigenitalium]UUD37305.1 50S ribosomal protein L6 [Mycoplasmopsis equigenitalium]
MSRVGNRILTIPAGVEIINNNNFVTVKGPKGELSRQFSNLITINVNGTELTTKRLNEEKHTKQLHGTTNSLLAAMLTGVTTGFKKELVLKGVGYKMALKGNQLEVLAGYSHPVLLDIPEGIKLEVPKPLEAIVSGIDKQAVGEFAAKIRKVRTPNPYSGKGMAYKDEVIKTKEGKTASK